MSTLETAIALAAISHAGQLDKAGNPYVFHPLRMMLSLPRDCAPEARIAAVLHDVIEDCGVTPERLRALGFSELVVETVLALTRRPEESYEQFIGRAAAHPIARVVKVADLVDNSDRSRLKEPITERDRERLERYARALRALA